MKISKKLRVYELETLETIPQNFRNKVTIPITYVPMPRKDHDTTRYWSWRAFMGERFVGEYTPYLGWNRKWKPPFPYLKRPMLSMMLDTGMIASYNRGVDAKKIARTLNILEFGSTRYGPAKLVKSIKKHCGIDARIIYSKKR